MCSIHISVGSVAAVIGLITATITLVSLIVFGIWQIRLYKKLEANTKDIRAKEDEIDGIEPDINGRTSGHDVNEGQRLRMVAAAKVQPLRELERLKQERQFLLDKSIFVKR